MCPTDRDPEGPRLNWTARARPPKDAPRTDRGGDTASSNARAVSRERARESAKTRVEVSVVDRDASRRERGTRATTRGSITRRRREGKGSVFGDIRREMATMSAETTRGPLGEMVEGDFLRDLVRARAEKMEGGTEG